MSFASTSISLLDIQTALGGTNPISLNEYYNNAVPGYGVGVLGVSAINSPIDIGSFAGKTIPTTITLSNSGQAHTDFAVNFTLNYKSSYDSTFQDLRFYDETTNTLLSHWYESVTNGTSANVWLKTPTLTNGTRIKVSTGNSSSTGTASSVFSLYEDFSSFDTINKWTTSSAAYTVSANNFQFTSGTFTYAITKSNYPMDMVYESSLSSATSNAIPEFILRGNTTNNTGIKARADCRDTLFGGVGSFLNNPFGGWAVLSAPYNYAFPSDGTSQKIKFTASSSNYTFSHNDTLRSSYTNSATSLMNTTGKIGFANHNTIPVNVSWVRAYPSTSNIITVSVS
jgi:hypothetical protein